MENKITDLNAYSKLRMEEGLRPAVLVTIDELITWEKLHYGWALDYEAVEKLEALKKSAEKIFLEAWDGEF